MKEKIKNFLTPFGYGILIYVGIVCFGKVFKYWDKEGLI